MRKYLVLLFFFLFFLPEFTSAQDTTTLSNDWLPLHEGNKWQYYTYLRYGDALNGLYCDFHWSYNSMDQIIAGEKRVINNREYQTFNDFIGFHNVAYDPESEKIYVAFIAGDTEYVLMDFKLNNGDSLLQLQTDGTSRYAKITGKNITMFGRTFYAKGFTTTSIANCSNCYVYTTYLFVKGYGLAAIKSATTTCFATIKDAILIEILQHNDTDSIHIKHSYVPEIKFEPVTFLPNLPVIYQTFKVRHYLDSQDWQEFKYIKNVFVDYYYKSNTDSIKMPALYLTSQLFEQYDASIGIDTNLYNRGYKMYYRIGATDKGIIPQTYYKPETGYYKLFWRDSTGISAVNENYASLNYSLSANYPNPFNPSTNIEYSIPSYGFVSLRIYDILGREIKTLVNENKQPGRYTIPFDAAGLPSGIYIYRMQANNFSTAKRMILIK